MASPWEVRTHFALCSDHFPVTAKVGGKPAKDRVVCRVDWEKFKSRTEEVGSDKEPVAQGNSTDVPRVFTWEVQAVLENCTSRKAAGRRNYLGLTKGEQGVIRAKNRSKKKWSRWKRERDQVIYRRVEREVKKIVSDARRRNILNQVDKADPQTAECWQLLRKAHPERTGFLLRH